MEERGITLLNPTFDLDFGKEAMAAAMLSVGKQLGKPKPLCAPALMSGAMAVRQYSAAAEKQGQELLRSLKPEDKVLVMITRNYGISDPVLNMGIPELLLQRIALGADHPNLYWPFGQHIISGAKLIAHHPNLYAVYLTNHGCGPDTMISHLFREEMGDKPYLQIEVDEHFSKVGVITRIEAFLNSLSHRETVPLPEDFDLKQVIFHDEKMTAKLPENSNSALYVPDFGIYTKYLCQYLNEAAHINAQPLPSLTRMQLAMGRAETAAKEYLPFTALLGSILSHAATNAAEKNVSYLVPSGDPHGAEPQGLFRAWDCISNLRTSPHGYASAGAVLPCAAGGGPVVSAACGQTGKPCAG